MCVVRVSGDENGITRECYIKLLCGRGTLLPFINIGVKTQRWGWVIIYSARMCHMVVTSKLASQQTQHHRTF